MSDHQDDFIHELRSLWQSVSSPSFEDADEKSSDDETQACIDWMKEAFESVAPPPYVAVERPTFMSRWGRGLAAAAAIILAFTAAWAFHSNNAQRSKPSDGARAVASSGNERPKSTAEIKASGAMTSTVLERGEIQLTKGRVRLILVRPTENKSTDEEVEK